MSTMTVEEYRTRRAELRQRYGENAKTSSARREQELAQFFVQSGWTQRQLATEEQCSQGHMDKQLRFGRFLNSNGIHDPSLKERAFRALWVSTDVSWTEDKRFDVITQQLQEGQKKPQHDRQAVRRVSKQLIEQFADGKWHALRDMTQAVEAESILVRGIMDRMVKEGTFQTFAERKSSGKGWYSYRMVKGGKKKIDLTAFQADSEGIVDEMWKYCTGHQVHFDQTTMRLLVAKLRQMIDKMAR